ncbi:GNAT family N-acetyltransferase [Isobaculum melis]|uniref:ElaA protein n=1 Tax=Isobaculum melis TaxID=142588 RepID=A0A1H9SQ26_9LACT|nr:GNAT family N-acetyltransferase [Isobaculum melis]SER86977.1 ElaA protein [Isobaculum melis]
MNWQVKKFDELSTRELFEIYYARTEIFVVEQNCPYQEVDYADLISTHVFQTEDERVIAYARIIPEEDGIHFGRVIVKKEARGNGLAKALISEVLTQIEYTYPNQPVKIQAQAYLEAFYGSFGFKAVSEPYLEDDIPHIDMVLQA